MLLYKGEQYKADTAQPYEIILKISQTCKTRIKTNHRVHLNAQIVVNICKAVSMVPAYGIIKQTSNCSVFTAIAFSL